MPPLLWPIVALVLVSLDVLMSTSLNRPRHSQSSIQRNGSTPKIKATVRTVYMRTVPRMGPIDAIDISGGAGFSKMFHSSSHARTVDHIGTKAGESAEPHACQWPPNPRAPMHSTCPMRRGPAAYKPTMCAFVACTLAIRFGRKFLKS